jgi:SAM-dependent methyltransferase
MTVRGRFTGVANIVRFNWPLFVAPVVLSVLCLWAGGAWLWLASATGVSMLVPLVISHWVYDRSVLYSLSWLKLEAKRVMTLHAGLDEVSAVLQTRFPDAEVVVFDFYNPLRHTEPSIERARQVYPPGPNQRTIDTLQSLPLADCEVDLIIFFLSAHEIRDEQERIGLFKEAGRVLSPCGKIVVVEHLRDVANFLAYSLGALHFHSERTWHRTFDGAGLHLQKTASITPMIGVYYLVKAHG